MSSRSLRLFALAIGCVASHVFSTTRGVAREPAAQRKAESAVAAQVDGQPILVSEIERYLARAVRQRPLDEATRATLFAQTLDRLIDQQLVLRFLRQRNLAPSDQDLEAAVDRVRLQAKQKELTLEEFLEASNITLPEAQREIMWQLAWQRYLARYRSDENLQKYFSSHARDFDGTQLRVAHILWKVKPDDRAGEREAMERAKTLREDIVAKRVTFEAAAAEHSQAPTGKDGGDIGLISRHDPMPEEFSTAAFALEAGQVSVPVRTKVGVHLIRCLEIQPGKKTWVDVRPELETAVAKYLFQWTADQERDRAKIQRTGAVQVR